MRTYTTKSGVQIGLLYRKPPPALSHDDMIIQRAFLSKRSPHSIISACAYAILGIGFLAVSLIVLTIN